MIIVKLWGGLGNQMFQYAAARRLAHVNGTELKLDIGWFGHAAAVDTQRGYELGVFNIRESFATPEEVLALRGRDISRWPKLVKRMIGICGYRPASGYRRERHYHFDPEILQPGDNLYLDGYWQSHRYFGDAEDVIREDFTLRSAPDGESGRLLHDISTCESVSLHVRRGDYVSNPHAGQYHGLCSLDYYARCVDHIAAACSDPRLFIFSDDPDWVLEQLHLPFPTVVVSHNNGQRAHEDLRLMSHCRHNIIANSSFSWWGAWLNRNHGRIVLAPQRWFAAAECDTSDLLPESWLRIAA